MGRWQEGRGALGPSGCELTSLVLAAAFPGCPLVPGSVGGLSWPWPWSGGLCWRRQGWRLLCRPHQSLQGSSRGLDPVTLHRPVGAPRAMAPQSFSPGGWSWQGKLWVCPSLWFRGGDSGLRQVAGFQLVQHFPAWRFCPISLSFEPQALTHLGSAVQTVLGRSRL